MCLRPDDELVKTIGDAVMLRFPTPQAAITALRELLQRELVVGNAVLLPRAGAHHGPAVVADGDYYGAAVNLAARVAAQARGGQLLVTTHVALAARDLGATIMHVGSVHLRNVGEPVDLYDVHVGEGADAVVTDPVCQMRVPSTGGTAIELVWAGRRFHFCGLPCVSRFAANPDRYIDRTPTYGWTLPHRGPSFAERRQQASQLSVWTDSCYGGADGSGLVLG